IISAVGHETDFTISDFVSDVRASTPSHAAELCVPNKTDILETINNSEDRLKASLSNSYDLAKQHFNRVALSNVIVNPGKILENKKLKLIYLEDKLEAYKPAKQIEYFEKTINNYQIRLNQIINNLLNRKQNLFGQVTEKLELVNPLSIMKKGYTVAKQNDVIKKSIKEINELKPLIIDFHDGSLNCEIKKKVVK
ncbi:MAG: hypothetical protein KAU02_06295, partial [Tenericutes bacterium]|nr:hypothetical protein [Mycoplasmatota bacterium]